MASLKHAQESDNLNANYDTLRSKFFAKYSQGEIHPDNEDVKNKVKITIYTHASDADNRSFSGYSGNTNIVDAQKEATIQAFKHMGLDLDAN